MLTAFAAEADETPQVIEAFGVNLLRMPMLPADVPADQRDTVLLAGRAGYAMAARRSSDAGPLLDELIARHPTLPHAHYARGVFFLTEDPEACARRLPPRAGDLAVARPGAAADRL